MPVWLKARCPVCHMEFEYPEGNFKPKVCHSYNCQHLYLHSPVYRYLREGVPNEALPGKEKDS